MSMIEHFPSSSPSPEAIETIASPETEQSLVDVVECAVNDPELKTLAAENKLAVAQGEINIKMLTKLKPSEGWAYKVYANESEETARKLVAAVYVTKKGLDYGTVEIAYFSDGEERGKGYATAGVSEVTEILTQKYEVLAKIDIGNEPSEAIVRKLGYKSMHMGEGSMNLFVKDKHRG
ncbi:GNAT family N-acetyltransferase [Candidatus Saccharibacteria bacterium]|nr:GNAT family N-acetyltransferase [Candidatus Saccharibacteria bacterium]